MDVVPSVWVASSTSTWGRLDDSHDCDLAVIGAGIVGLTAADVASSHGLRVTVVDAGTIGGGASGRNAAGVAPVWGAQTPDGAIGVLGTDRAAILNAACTRLVVLVQIIPTHTLR